MLYSIADGVFSVDRNMRITSFNRAAEQITGWSSREVIGAPCSSIFRSSICGDTCVLVQSVQKVQSIAKRNIFIKSKDGRTIPISIVAAPLLDPQGSVIGGVEAFHDITSSMQYDLILESIADGVFTVDRNWKISSFTRAAELITGWAREDAVGKSCGEVFRSSICGEDCAIAQSLYSGKPVANRSIFIHNVEGGRIPISISAAPLHDHEGNIIGGVETFRDLSVVTALRKQLSKRFTFGEIISKSAAMQRIFTILPEIAQSDSNVLVLGESGTGKELVARAIHTSSLRHRGPFVAVNCGALPETLLESELFGYKAGAFTDAKQDRAGRFATAEKGTLFLDEIGDIPAALQVKLLRVLQNRMYEPLGSSQPVKADVRIITATNRDLQALVEEGIFREDLYYRLNVVKIHLPPLRERKEDIPMLVDHFIRQFSTQKGKDIVGISDAALGELMRYHYPGNIRELENIIEYAFILCPGGFIQPEYLPEPFAPEAKDEPPPPLLLEKPQTLEEIEKQAIYQSLERNQWRRLATCRELGISKDTLRRKIQRYGLRDPFEVEME
ncbi:MAG: sigma 54-interacting transcriptional regulator [Deltaproteobacteria bacterium]